MRLSVKEIDEIVRVAREVYGESVKVYLFGSRLDDKKKGGDIDLLVRTDAGKRGILERIRMVARLKQVLGEQKIDVVGDYEESVVVQEALRNGVLLA